MAPKKVPVKFCRHCGRMIPQDSVDCPYCDKNTIPKVAQKECPFCGERVRARAVKCKHCGEFVDGRQTEQQGAIYIEKAIISGGTEGPVELRPADATEIEGERADPQQQLDAPKRKELPPGQEPQPPAKPPQAAPPARAESPGPPAVQEEKKEKEDEKAEEQEGPPAQYECPGCGRYVFEGDNFCENCGRDLSLPRERKEKLGPPQRYAVSDYALMVGAATPLGLMLGPQAALGIAAAGALLSAWCLWRIFRPDSHLQGAGSAAGGLAAAGLWALLILLFT